VLLSLGIFIFL